MSTQKLSSHRPHLDHLRNQAKQLLARLRNGDADAAAEFITHLPAARTQSVADVQRAGYRLADAQSAVARRLGFAGWPALSRHVDTLRALEGAWSFTTLEVGGQSIPAAMLSASRILMDGDRFRTESPEANYDGEFLIDVEAQPHTIDITFIEGPEAGNQSLGIFALDGDTLTICLGLTGAARPTTFATAPGSHHALETLHRASAARPAGVTGGTPLAKHASQAAPSIPEAFDITPSTLDVALAGEWAAVDLVRDGKRMPAGWLENGRRIVRGDELRVTFGGQLIVHARVRYDDTHAPAHIDYLYLAGESQGRIAHGICELREGALYVNMAPAGVPRPTDWESAPGSGRSFSRWRPVE